MLLWKSTSEKDKCDEKNNISNTHVIHRIRLGTQYGSIKQRDSVDSRPNYRCHGMDHTQSRVLDHQLLIKLLREVVAPSLCTMTDLNPVIPGHKWYQFTMMWLWKRKRNFTKMCSSKGLTEQWEHPLIMGDLRSLTLNLTVSQHKWNLQPCPEGLADIGQPPPAYCQDQKDSYKTIICPSKTNGLPRTRWGGV